MISEISHLGRFFSYCKAKASYKQRIAHLLNVDIKQIKALYREINNSEFINNIMKKTGRPKGFIDLSMSCVLRAPTLYVLCRVLKPDAVVETGVANGFSSAFILEALEANTNGHLYSIDLPNQPGQVLNENRTTGWLVPENLRKRWTLTLGSSKEKLLPLLENLVKIDIFYHDSEHSYENMSFEFNTAYPFINDGGLILSDDITDNNAFRDFSASVFYSKIELFKLGIIKKVEK